MIKTLLKGSRFLVLAAVLGSLGGAAALLAYGFAETIVAIVDVVTKGELSSKGAKNLMLAFIEIFDLFLLGTVLLIMALYLYELVIDDEIKLPEKLEINSFEDLKTNLVTVVIVVMAVTFLGHVVSWDGEKDLLRFGLPVMLVIVALNFYLWISKAYKKK
jgi:uncharacterized membrane protein YqhA